MRFGKILGLAAAIGVGLMVGGVTGVMIGAGIALAALVVLPRIMAARHSGAGERTVSQQVTSDGRTVQVEVSPGVQNTRSFADRELERRELTESAERSV